MGINLHSVVCMKARPHRTCTSGTSFHFVFSNFKSTAIVRQRFNCENAKTYYPNGVAILCLTIQFEANRHKKVPNNIMFTKILHVSLNLSKSITHSIGIQWKWKVAAIKLSILSWFYQISVFTLLLLPIPE